MVKLISDFMLLPAIKIASVLIFRHFAMVNVVWAHFEIEPCHEKTCFLDM